MGETHSYLLQIPKTDSHSTQVKKRFWTRQSDFAAEISKENQAETNLSPIAASDFNSSTNKGVPTKLSTLLNINLDHNLRSSDGKQIQNGTKGTIRSLYPTKYTHLRSSIVPLSNGGAQRSSHPHRLNPNSHNFCKYINKI